MDNGEIIITLKMLVDRDIIDLCDVGGFYIGDTKYKGCDVYGCMDYKVIAVIPGADEGTLTLDLQELS